MEPEPLAIAVALIIGMVLGLFFFGTLWLTVRRVPHSRHPAGLVFGSLLGRLAVVLAGFFLLMDGSWERPVACLAGFIVARQVMLRVVGHPASSDPAEQGGPPA